MAASFHSSSKVVFSDPRPGFVGLPVWFSFVGGFSSTEALKDIVIFSEEEPDPCPKAALLSLLLPGLCIPPSPD